MPGGCQPSSALYRCIEAEPKPKWEAQVAQAFQPYQTKPGERMLHDWAEYRVPIAGLISRVNVDQSIIGFEGLTERIHVDNTKVLVEDASREHFRWNGKFLQFCGFWRIEPTRSAPCHPWSKGKAEKPFDHLEAHFIQGARFGSFAEFLSCLKDYERTANSTVHSVTHKTPAKLFEMERQVLRPIPRDPSTQGSRRLVGVAEEIRTVSSDCLVCYGGNRYSVPHVFVRSQVWVRPRKGTTLELHFQKGELIATYQLKERFGAS